MSDKPGTVRRKPGGRYVAVRVHGGPDHPPHFVLISTFTGGTSTVNIADPKAAIIYDKWPIIADPDSGGEQ